MPRGGDTPVQATARRGDLVSRLGGEEFAVICLNTDFPGAMHMAERLRAAIETQTIDIAEGGHPLQCTVTVGVSQGFADAHALEAALQQADAALYRGKAAGRNRVETAGPSMATPSYA